MPQAAPTGLVNSAVTKTSFTGSWTAAPGASGYNVLISIDGGQSNTYLNTISGTSYDFTTTGAGPLMAGATYTWLVQAFGGTPTEYSDLAAQSVTMAADVVQPGVEVAQVEVIRATGRVTGTLTVVRA